MSLHEIVRAERQRLQAGGEACGQVCDDGCHGPIRCVRARHPHDPTADAGIDESGRPRPPGDVAPHLGYGSDGELVQWTCLPGDHDGLTDQARAAKRQGDADAARAQATHALYASIDPQLLVSLLREGGHL